MSLDGYLLSIDQGTTSSRALILDIQGNIISQKNFEFKQYFPNDGWVEHDPIEILKTTQDAINFVIKETNISPKDINIAGITNQERRLLHGINNRKASLQCYCVAGQTNRKLL